ELSPQATTEQRIAVIDRIADAHRADSVRLGQRQAEYSSDNLPALGSSMEVPVAANFGAADRIQSLVSEVESGLKSGKRLESGSFPYGTARYVYKNGEVVEVHLPEPAYSLIKVGENQWQEVRPGEPPKPHDPIRVQIVGDGLYAGSYV